jgi:chemotaxis-related protein WspB
VLYVLVTLGRDRYALAASMVIEVVPLVRLKALVGAPAGAAGLMNFRGTALPVVDLALVATGTPTPETNAARIVVVRYAAPNSSRDEALGLLVPDARDTMRLDPDSFVAVGVAAAGAPYFGHVLATPEGMLQRLDLHALLTAELRLALYRIDEAA